MSQRMIRFVVLILILGSLLTACSPFDKSGAPTPEGNKSDSEGSQTTVQDKQTPSEEPSVEQVVRGVINRIDSYLVLLTEDDQYQIMDFGEGLAWDDFSEGDHVEITYTGILGDDEFYPIITSIEAIS
ncbi:MAG: hypothetical protein ACOX7N_06770 [Lawsonibacter sp.]|jgi:hypothetical protein